MALQSQQQQGQRQGQGQEHRHPEQHLDDTAIATQEDFLIQSQLKQNAQCIQKKFEHDTDEELDLYLYRYERYGSRADFRDRLHHTNSNPLFNNPMRVMVVETRDDPSW